MRLLLAEDEKALSAALVTILKHNNYAVDAVYNGRDALDYLDTGLYDGVILDIMMPEVDGLTVLKTLRARGSSVPVLLLTAKSQAEDKIAGLDLGADDYLAKPFHTGELLARIRAMTRRREAVANNTLTFGDLALDRVAFTLSTPRAAVTLTAKEFQIMEMLMQNPDQLFSAERIMDKVWGLETDTDFTVVWTYVSYLRKKLKTIGSAVTLRAVRNVGYGLLAGDKK